MWGDLAFYRAGVKNLRSLLWVSLAAFLILGGWLIHAGTRPERVFAQGAPPAEEPPVRKATITYTFTRTFWWLVEWEDNEVFCRLAVEHEGLPTYNEIEGLCGKKTAEYWLKSQPCNLAETPTNRCPGLYLLEMGSEPGSRQIEVELPIPEVWVSVDGCDPLPGERKCTHLPNLLFTAVEPLPNETIISIQGTFNGEPFSCMGAECRLPLQPTPMEGVTVEFWADSSFGDSSQRYTARVRLVPWGDFMNPDGGSTDPGTWYVDVLSAQWVGGEIASCAYTWQSFPPLEGPPEWLSKTVTPEDLATDTGYYYLAGALIQNGVVQPTGCLDGGLAAPHVASACGVEAARPYLVEWQNRFDQDILQVSQDTGVPARLLKNVFSRESQIWPGIFSTYKEAGLGQLTEQGADTVLLWNPSFFAQFCPLVLNQAFCDLGWGNLGAAEQAMLRGALVKKVNAACPTCPTGIDISQAQYSVRIFAEGLLANCEQTGRILRNLTGLEPGLSSSYEDLWRFTLVNYNAGPGCLSNAVQQALARNEALTWSNITAHLEPACQGAIGYVEDISRVFKATPTPTPWLLIGEPLPTATPSAPLPLQPIFTPTPGGGEAFPTPTPPPSGYQPPESTPDETAYPYP